jgi:metal-responsive CopG/Arc/MetJ family transcriptional regulator
MRIIIDLPEHLVAALAALCEKENISRGEAIQRALEVMLAEKQSVDREAAFGSWQASGDSRATVEGIREEWQSFNDPEKMARFALWAEKSLTASPPVPFDPTRL